MLRVLLGLRFILDMIAIVLFLKYLFFFLNLKVEKLLSTGKKFTAFHKFVSQHIKFTHSIGHILYTLHRVSGAHRVSAKVLFRSHDLGETEPDKSPGSVF